jgi:Flp pilus assembly protein TadD
VPADPAAVIEATAAMMDAMISDSETPAGTRRILERVKGGETPAQAMGLSRDDLEVLYAVGFQQITRGELDRAQDSFIRLVGIDPLEARHRYCLSLVRQLKGDLKGAAAGYIQFLALDATNPEGYLRLGEVHLAAGEPERAAEFFVIAATEAARRPDGAEAAALAQAQLDRLGAGGSTDGATNGGVRA